MLIYLKRIMICSWSYSSSRVPYSEAAAGARGTQRRHGGGTRVVTSLVRRVHGQLAAEDKSTFPFDARVCTNKETNNYLARMHPTTKHGTSLSCLRVSLLSET